MHRKPYSPEDFKWMQWDGPAMAAALDGAVREAKIIQQAIITLPDADRTFENTFAALDRMYIPLNQVGSKIGFLMAVSPVAEIRTAAQKVADDLDAAMLDFVFDEELYRACKAASQKVEDLSTHALKFRDETMRGYRRLGFDLDSVKRAELQENKKQIQILCNKFDKNLNDSKKQIIIGPNETVGLPEVYLAGLEQDVSGNYIVTTKYPDYFPFIENSALANKRKELVDAFLSLGGDENIALLRSVLELRQKNAALLSYPSHAAYVIEEKMAKTVDAVMEFLYGLAKDLRPLLNNDMAAIALLKKEETGTDEPICYYDVAYYGRMLAEKKYSLNKNVVREYFPLKFVLDALFALYAELFSISFEKVEGFSVWHPDVEVYKIIDADGTLLSYFCLDLHPRDGKYGHAAEFPLVTSYQLSGGDEQVIQVTPVACMVANFPKGAPDTPSLMPHDEVETLFHEFGHVIHQNLAQQRFNDQSGTNVARDFVEAPSQMLENWVWNRDMLKRISRHYKTGEPLPDELINQMLAAKNNMSGYMNMRQLALSIFDMKLHVENHNDRIVPLYNEIVEELLGVGMLPEHRYPSGFGHLVGGYDAGYYGYMWSNVYAADMFSRFAEEGVMNKKLGMEYRKKILEVGGSRDEMESLVDFLGRQPNNKAFLKEIGL